MKLRRASRWALVALGIWLTQTTLTALGCSPPPDGARRGPDDSRPAARTQQRAKEKSMSQWVEFETLREATGVVYEGQRDAILASTPDLKLRLKSYLAHPDRRAQITARILEGWAEHG
ncbi:MAG: hypothetical protein ACRD68_10200, partial [Pyrinomonadaceae bacterium]